MLEIPEGHEGTLPCLHSFHLECLDKVRAHGDAQRCPNCRADLPAPPVYLFEEAARKCVALERKKVCGESLSEAEEHELATVGDLWRLSAEQGYIRAQLQLGIALEAGTKGLPQSCSEARKWYRRAALQGHSLAQYRLGCLILGESGIDEAANWLRLAADQGHTEAQYDLGVVYAQKKMFTEAAKWYYRAAESGNNSIAEFTVGVMFLHGQGVGQSYSEALRWFTRAAKQGHPEAQCSLGQLFECGHGVSRSDTEAARW